MLNGNLDSDYTDDLDSLYWNCLFNDMDLPIVIVGRERSGKSSLAKATGRHLNQIRKEYWGLEPAYEPSKSIALTPLRFGRCISNAGKNPDSVCRPGGVVIYDEAVTGLNARGSMKTCNVALNTILMQCGMKNLALILNIPSFFGLDQQNRVRRVALVLRVKTETDTVIENGRRFYRVRRGLFDLYAGTDIHKISRSPDGAEVWPRPTKPNLRFTMPDVSYAAQENYEEQEKEENIAREVRKLEKWEEKQYGRVPDGQLTLDEAD